MIHIEGTEQQIFDRVVEHLAIQKCRAGMYDKTRVWACRYKDSYGRRCAIGCLIPLNKYRPEFESQSIQSLIENKIIKTNVDVSFLALLQMAHDVCINRNRLKKYLEEIATKYNLNSYKIALITEWS